MKFQHRFSVRASQADVADFHSRAESLMAITPPIVPMQTHSLPTRLRAGDEMAFTMWMGPIPVRWRAYIGQVSATGFSDHQMEGPFRYWAHRHSFLPQDENSTDVVDEIQAGLRWHPLWALVGLAMWLGLPALFAYRAWKTRRLLEKASQ